MSFNAYRQHHSTSDDETDLETTARALFDPLSLKLADEYETVYEIDSLGVEETLPSPAQPSSPARSLSDISMKSLSSPEVSDTEVEGGDVDASRSKRGQSPTLSMGRKRKRRRVDGARTSRDSDADDEDEVDETSLKSSWTRKGKLASRDAVTEDEQVCEERSIKGLPSCTPKLDNTISRYGTLSAGRVPSNPIPRKVTVTGLTESFVSLGCEQPAMGPRLQSQLSAEQLPTRPVTRLRHTRRKTRARFNAHAFTAADDPFINISVNVAASESMESVHEQRAGNEADEELLEIDQTDGGLLETSPSLSPSRIVKKARTRYRPAKPLLKRELVISEDEAELSLGRTVRHVKARTAVSAPRPVRRASPESKPSPAELQDERLRRTARDWRRIRAGHKALRQLASTQMRHAPKSYARPTDGLKFSARSAERRAAKATRTARISATQGLGRDQWQARVGNWSYCDVVRQESWTDWPWVMRRSWTLNDALLPEFRRSLPPAASTLEPVAPQAPTPRSPRPEADLPPAKRQAPVSRAIQIPAAITSLRAQAAQRRSQREHLRRVREDATRRRLELEEAERLARDTEIHRLASLAQQVERARVTARTRSPPPAYIAPVPVRAVQLQRLPSYLPSRYSYRSPPPPPPYNAQTDCEVRIPARFVVPGDADEAMAAWMDVLPAMAGSWPAADTTVRRLEAQVDEVERDLDMQRNGWDDAPGLEQGARVLGLHEDEEDEIAAAHAVLELEDREREDEAREAAGLLSRVRGWLRW